MRAGDGGRAGGKGQNSSAGMDASSHPPSRGIVGGKGGGQGRGTCEGGMEGGRGRGRETKEAGRNRCWALPGVLLLVPAPRNTSDTDRAHGRREVVSATPHLAPHPSPHFSPTLPPHFPTSGCSALKLAWLSASSLRQDMAPLHVAATMSTRPLPSSAARAAAVAAVVVVVVVVVLEARKCRVTQVSSS